MVHVKFSHDIHQMDQDTGSRLLAVLRHSCLLIFRIMGNESHLISVNSAGYNEWQQE